MAIAFINKDERLSAFVWELKEDIPKLLKLAELTVDEYERFLLFRAESRKKQWLAVRSLVNKVFGRKVLISYSSEGCPFISGEEFISISHTDTYVAIVIGIENMLGIDVESISRNYTKVHSRFITDDERLFFSDKNIGEQLYLPLAWSAKEAAFKAALKCELDFIRDISIVGVSTDERFSVGEITVSLNPLRKVGVFKFYTLNNHVIVWGDYGSL